MIIPTDKEIFDKVKFFRDEKTGKLNVIIIEDIYFRIFGIDMILPIKLYSDGGSFPKGLFWLDPFDKRGLFGVILHDYLYKVQFLPRFLADTILAGGVSKKSKFHGISFFAGLAPFGFIAGNGNQKKGLLKFPEAKERLLKHICNK